MIPIFEGGWWALARAPEGMFDRGLVFQKEIREIEITHNTGLIKLFEKAILISGIFYALEDSNADNLCMEYYRGVSLEFGKLINVRVFAKGTQMREVTEATKSFFTQDVQQIIISYL